LAGLISKQTKNMMWGYGPMMGGWGLAGGIFSLIFWVLIILVIVALVRWAMWSSRGGRNSWHGEDSAMQILKERYAKGEIDKKEFEEKMKDLNKQ